jgi:excisionase family DNA binding protein
MGELTDYLTTRQAAEVLGVATVTVQKWIAQGKLLAARLDNRWLIHKDTLESFNKPRIGLPRFRLPRAKR